LKFRDFERRVIVGTRYLTIIAALGSLAGALLMFFLGTVNIYVAFSRVFEQSGEDEVFGAASIIGVIESLDRYLIAIVLLYFAYGVYSLFIHPDEPEERFAMPAWLRVRQIGQLKQVVAELIVVIIFVLFLRQALRAFSGHDASMGWSEVAALLLLPVSAVLLALALRLVELHPKPMRKMESPTPPSLRQAGSRDDPGGGEIDERR